MACPEVIARAARGLHAHWMGRINAFSIVAPYRPCKIYAGGAIAAGGWSAVERARPGREVRW